MVTLELLHHACSDCVAKGARTVHLDFAAMTDCPSALFLQLLEINETLRVHDVELVLINLEAAVLAIVQPPDLLTPQ